MTSTVRAIPLAAGLVCACLASACETALVLPAAPSAVPRIDRIEPRAAFGDDEISLVGSGFDEPADGYEVRFPGGFTARGLRLEEGRLVVRVPWEVQVRGPLSLTTPLGVSPPSAEEFVPLGYGHPVFGDEVATLRFRHRPVGLVDTEASVVVASTLLDLLLTDAGSFTPVTGTPVAFARGSGANDALLATRGRDGGRFFEVDRVSGRVLRASAAAPVVERFLLRGAGGGVARTIGVDPWGGVSLTHWEAAGERLEPTRRALAVEEVLGAATDAEGTVWLVGRVLSGRDVETALLRVTESGVERVWAPEESGNVPTGPLALAQTQAGRVAVLALADGDLAFVDVATGTWRHVLMVSFGAVGALATGVDPGRVVLTKPLDGAVFQYDVATEELDWTVQVRGEPTVLDVAPEIGEVAVANGEDNVVDIIEAHDGTWLGRISFALGLGSADGGDGSAAAAYSYHPDAPERPFRLDLLARAVGMVLTLDPASLDLLGATALAGEASDALRLAVTPDLRTLVVHRHAFGLLEEEGERLVLEGLRSTPVAVDFLPDGRVVLGTSSAVEVFAWRDGLLEREGGLALAQGTSLVGLGVHAAGDRVEVLVSWRSGTGYGGGLYDAEALVAGGAPRVALALESSLGDGLGVLRLVDGPALAFGRSSLGTPALVPWGALAAGGAALPSLVDRPLLAGVSPDRRFVTWLDEGAGEHMVRLLRYRASTDEAAGALDAFASYRLPARGAGPLFDPSGQWMYVPVPKLDMLVVVQ